LPELRHLQVQRSRSGIERAVTVTVAPGRPLLGPFVESCADQAVNVALHHQLKNSLGNRAQQVALIALLQKL
jgi:hypothetical protein